MIGFHVALTQYGHFVTIVIRALRIYRGRSTRKADTGMVGYRIFIVFLPYAVQIRVLRYEETITGTVLHSSGLRLGFIHIPAQERIVIGYHTPLAQHGHRVIIEIRTIRIFRGRSARKGNVRMISNRIRGNCFPNRIQIGILCNGKCIRRIVVRIRCSIRCRGRIRVPPLEGIAISGDGLAGIQNSHFRSRNIRAVRIGQCSLTAVRIVNYLISLFPNGIERLIGIHLNGIACNIRRRSCGRIFRPSDKTITISLPVSGLGQVVVVLYGRCLVIFINCLIYDRIRIRICIVRILIIGEPIHLQAGNALRTEITPVALGAGGTNLLRDHRTIAGTGYDLTLRSQ